MPGNILNADTMFPNLREGTADEKIEKIGSYLYMLLEQLRYSMGNLDAKNFNESGLSEIASLITEPVYVRLEDEEGRLSELSVTAAGLESRVSDAEGNISSLTLTANGLDTRVSNAEGDISSLELTVNGITLEVTNDKDSSSLKIMSNGVQLGSTGTIQFTGDVVFASDLSSGTTTVSGDCIRTGVLDTQDIKLRNLLEVVDSFDNTAGYVGYGTSNIDSSAAMVISGSTRNYGVVCSNSGAKIAGVGGEVVVTGSKIAVTPVHPLSPAGGWGYEFYYNKFTAVRGEDLGSAAAPWGYVYCKDVYINGQSVKAALGL